MARVTPESALGDPLATWQNAIMNRPESLPSSAVVRHHHEALLLRLNAHSSHYRDPVSAVAWDSLRFDAPWLPEPLLSLYGLPEFDALSVEERIRLSQAEFVAFCELGLWLEALFIERLGRNRLAEMYRDPAAYRYQLHEMREEIGHSLMFLELQRRAQIPFMSSARDRPRLASAFARFAPEGSAAFWATILVGENIPDRLNRRIFADKELPAAVLAITQIHMREEARHMAFARATIQERSRRLSAWQKRLLSPLLRRGIHQFLHTCFFPSANVYAAAGLAEPVLLARRVRHNPHRRRLMDECAAPSRDFLRSQGFSL